MFSEVLLWTHFVSYAGREKECGVGGGRGEVRALHPTVQGVQREGEEVAFEIVSAAIFSKRFRMTLFLGALENLRLKICLGRFCQKVHKWHVFGGVCGNL